MLKYGIPVALSVLLVWFFYKNMDMEAIKQSLREDVNFWWFVPVIVVSIFSHVFRACRWRLQLRALGIDAAFIGANGILDGDVSTSNMDEGRIQQLAFSKADSRYLIADSSKIGKRDFYTFCRFFL